MADLNDTLKSIQASLDAISRRELSISGKMRSLADESDILASEMGRLRVFLQQLPTELSQEKLIQERPVAIEKVLIDQEAEPFLKVFYESEKPKQIKIDTPSQEARVDPKPDSVESKFYHRETRPLFGLKQTSDETFADKQSSSDTFEIDLGIKWLSRIGIVALLIGIAMALSYSFPSFSNEMKILTGIITAFILFFSTRFLKEASPILVRVLQGGGLSVGYLSLFSMFFMPQVQLFDSPFVGLGLLFAYVVFVLFLAHRLNSQTVALLSLAYGYYASKYAIDPGIAFLLAGMLSLGTTWVTKYHQDWKILPKVNLLGALIVYLVWANATGVSQGYYGKIYLFSTFLMFHTVSLLRGKDGDLVLLILNTFGFYCLYSVTQGQGLPNGSLEFALAAHFIGSFFLFNSLHEENQDSVAALGLLVFSQLFGAIGTLSYFHSATRSVVLSAEALSIGLLSLKGRYRGLFKVSSFCLWALSLIAYMTQWPALSDISRFLSGSWIVVIACVLEGVPYRQSEKGIRGAFLAVALFILLSVTTSSVHSEWRTMVLVLEGFAFLVAGFLWPRKTYRWIGLGWVFLPGAISIVADIIHLDVVYKIGVFILLGLGLLAGSYGYSRLEKGLLQEENE